MIIKLILLYISMPVCIFQSINPKPTFFMSTEFLNHINWLAVLVAALAFFMLGALWYSKALFATPWIRHTKVDASNPDATKGMAAIMFASFVFMFIISTGIAILAERMELYGWMSGLKLGALTGFFFGVTALSISYVYEKRPSALHVINGGYTLIGNIIAGIIICVWQ